MNNLLIIKRYNKTLNDKKCHFRNNKGWVYLTVSAHQQMGEWNTIHVITCLNEIVTDKVDRRKAGVLCLIGIRTKGGFVTIWHLLNFVPMIRSVHAKNSRTFLMMHLWSWSTMTTLTLLLKLLSVLSSWACLRSFVYAWKSFKSWILGILRATWYFCPSFSVFVIT